MYYSYSGGDVCLLWMRKYWILKLSWVCSSKFFWLILTSYCHQATQLSTRTGGAGEEGKKSAFFVSCKIISQAGLHQKLYLWTVHFHRKRKKSKKRKQVVYLQFLTTPEIIPDLLLKPQRSVEDDIIPTLYIITFWSGQRMETWSTSE